MEKRRMKVVQCPSEALSFTNRAVVSSRDFVDRTRHVEITTASNRKFLFTIEPVDKLEPNTISFNLPARKWAELSLNDVIEVKPYNVDTRQYVAAIVVEVDFLMKNSQTNEPYDTDEMAKEFTMQFPNQAFTVGQIIGFKFADKKLLKLVVKEMEAVSVEGLQQGAKASAPKKLQVGIVVPNTSVVFEKAETGNVNLTGKSKGRAQQQSIINPNWDFENMGIGGLDKEFNDIFRRAFASRVFPVELIEQLGLKHVRGILLFGPPGTGKTLMARQIGTMLNAREPKIVNGPQILDKYVGESEANIRRLFEDAENEFKRVGNNSGLHIIIFDEIDAICKARGSMAGSSGVHDTVVNQLLSKIDGVESLNNILVIGMTNRRDMIDEALLRPGRLEVQMEIGLPDEKGRAQILAIHTHLMRKFDKLSSDVNLNELAALTKNFSGAEIEGLVRAAQSCAMNRLIKASSKVEVDPDAMQKLLITRNDFMHALEHDVKPAFGSNAEAIEQLVSGGMIYWGAPVTSILEDGQIFINQARNPSSSGLVSILLEGPPNTGKTALAAQLALGSDFPFVKLCSPDEMVGYTETAKCLHIRKIFDDAYKSSLSCLIVDNIERLIDYVSVGPRFSNLVLQALLVVLKKKPPKGRKLLVLCTTSRKEILEEMEMLPAFTAVMHVQNLTQPDHLNTVLKTLAESNAPGSFSPHERAQIAKLIDGKRLWVGIKKLLALIDMSREMDPQYRVPKFLAKLEDEGCLEMKAF